MIQSQPPDHFNRGKSFSFLPTGYNEEFQICPATLCPVSVKLAMDNASFRCPLTMPKNTRLPYLLHIAPELREQIYQELLYDRPSSLFHLLTVNRQISREVKPWIFRQPLAFDGQQSLYLWLSSADPMYLPDVFHIRFVLHDLNPDQIVKALGERLARASVPYTGSQSMGWPYKEAFDRELSQIRSALRRFPNLKSFTLLENAFGDPQPPYRMLVAFAALALRDLPSGSFMMPQRVQHALDRSLFPRLRHLQIIDYGFRQTPGFPRFLEPFPSLDILEVCNSVQSVTPADWGRNTCQQPTSPLGKLPVLQELVLCMYHYNERASERHPTFSTFEPDILAIRENAKSLKVFKLLCNRWIDRRSAPMQQLLGFIQSSSLSTIETGFWWTPHPNDYPKSVTTISVRFEDHYPYYSQWLHEFSNAIDPMGSSFFADHLDLKEIRLYLPSIAYSKRQDYQKHQIAPKAHCWNHGVHLKVFYKDFRCEHRHKSPFVSDGGAARRRLSYGYHVTDPTS